MKIVTVIPLKKSAVGDELTYFTSKEIASGSIVEISIRNKKTLGLVLSSLEASGAKTDIKGMNFNLKKIIEVKERSFFRKEYIESVFLTAKYFAAKKNDTIAALIPSVVREEYDKLSKENEPKPDAPVLALPRKNLRKEKLIFQAPLSERISFYKTLIRGSFAEKKSVFIVLPTEHDIENFYQELCRGIEKFSFYVHSGISKKKIIEKISTITSSSHPVLVIGTAPFLSIPREDLGVIVLEHEGSNAYKMIGRPHIDLRFFTEIFAEKAETRFIMGDTLLRFETIGRREIDGLAPVNPLSFRTDFAGEISIENQEKFKVLTEQSIEEIKHALTKKRNIFIFSLRKGLATMTVCRDCNNTLLCDRCSAPVVLYISKDGGKKMFVCNRCKREINSKTVCPVCKSWNLMPLGVGTDTVVEKVKEIFQKEKSVRIFKLDKESVKTAREAEKMIAEFEQSKGAILVGTEMALFYIKNKIPLSIIASLDSLWSIPSFRMSEKIINIMIGIIDKTSSSFIIQTKNENDRAILSVQGGNLLNFVREELSDRKKLGYPPFKRFIKITHLGDKVQTSKAKDTLNETLDGYNPEIFSGFVAKQQNKYVTNALIKLDTKSWSLPEISPGSSIDEDLLARISSLPPNFEVFVDPEDLL